jgi:mono/diheme cytochrome c family protein
VRQSAIICLLALLGACTAEVAGGRQPFDGARDRQAFDVIERGRNLAIAGDCAACHTAPGGKPYAGGRSVETPFGSLLASNLTPDRETGIGAWSDNDFLDAVRQGRGRGGKHLYPAMPYTYYTRATQEDVLAIRAFLDTVEPVRNEVVSNQMPFPFNIRIALAAWNALFFTAGRFEPVAGKSDEWNAGAYLVEGLTHCGACHTAKNLLGGDKTSHALQGGILEGWYAPNLTGDLRVGLGSWSVEDLVTYLRTGHNGTAAATGPMAEVVTKSTSRMAEADLKAIAVYLKDQPARPDDAAKPIAADDRMMRAGQAIYVDNCAACHTSEGVGSGHLFPALKGSASVQSADPTSLIRIVLQGAQSAATDGAPTGPSMPALSWKLSDAQAAAVITYIRNGWGNSASSVSARDVNEARHRLSQNLP